MVSYSDLKPSQVKEKPFENIGASDICSIETNHKGFLRKEGKIERSLQKLVQKHHLHWRRYFAILSQGCVYIYRDEHSSSPKVKFSLLNYHRLQRNHTIPHSFEILPCTTDVKVYRFSCESDSERLDWMRALYVSLLVVHKEPLPSNDITKHLKAYEEHSIVESAVGRAGIHEDVYEVDDSSSSDDDGYDKPDENLKKGNKYTRDPTIIGKTLPDIPNEKGGSLNRLQKSASADQGTTYDEATSGATPKRSMSVDNETSIPGTGQSKNTKRQTDKEKIKPIVAPKPKPSGKPRSPRNESPIEDLPEQSPQGAQASYANSLTELPQKRGEVSYLNMSDTGYVGHDPSVEYMFSGTKEDAASELNLTDPGTFLIRDSSEANKKVLVVQFGNTLVSYKCNTKDNKIYLDLTLQFKSYHELVEHYKKNSLPNRDVKLLKGFNALDPPRPVTVPQDGAYEPVGLPTK